MLMAIPRKASVGTRVARLLPVLVLSFLAISTSEAIAKSCAPVRDVIPGAGTNDAINIRAYGTSCRVARSLPRPYIREMRSGEDGIIRGWRCVALDDGAPWRVRCTKGDNGRVTWRLG